VRQLAEHAEKRDPSVVERAGEFYAQHPTLVQGLGAAALALIIRHVSRPTESYPRASGCARLEGPDRLGLEHSRGLDLRPGFSGGHGSMMLVVRSIARPRRQPTSPVAVSALHHRPTTPSAT
jgi:hypothetical protein